MAVTRVQKGGCFTVRTIRGRFHCCTNSESLDEILETILKLYGKPGIDASYLPKLIRNKATGEVRRGYGDPDSSLEEVCWQFDVGK
jgi:hypothetical protein